LSVAVAFCIAPFAFRKIVSPLEANQKERKEGETEREKEKKKGKALLGPQKWNIEKAAASWDARYVGSTVLAEIRKYGKDG
jgi:hypothetical protein